jgi:hypothetical protein
MRRIPPEAMLVVNALNGARIRSTGSVRATRREEPVELRLRATWAALPGRHHR